MLKNIPNILTLSRFFITPVIVMLVYLSKTRECDLYAYMSFFLFILAGITDYLDGMIARKFDLKSDIGSCFDNIADKFLNNAVIITMLWNGKIILTSAMILLLREVIVSGVREFISLSGKTIPVLMVGKIKTTFEFIGLATLLLPNMSFILGNIMLAFAAVFSLIGLIKYMTIAFFTSK